MSHEEEDTCHMRSRPRGWENMKATKRAPSTPPRHCATMYKGSHVCALRPEGTEAFTVKILI
jgi:hypothetical protein